MTARQIALTIFCSCLSAVLAVMLYSRLVPVKQQIVYEKTDDHYARNINLDDIRPRTFLSSSPTDFTKAARAITPAVVFIRAYYRKESGLFQQSRQNASTSTGSGVIISEDGLIVTNNHVIEGGQEFEVVLSDKREFSAEIVGTDPSTDLAVLKINSSNLPNVELGNSDSLLIGEWVLAVGNPFNLESTVTAGIVSAKGRNIDILEGQDRIESFIQTDAVVNPGNSGGALVNTNGELMGINTAIITRSGGYEGYSFAVPVNLVRKVVRDITDYGSVQRGLLGAYIADMTADLAKEKGMDEVSGVLITRVTDDSGADNAGLQEGDVIVGLNGKTIRTVPALQEILGQLRPGDRIALRYIRANKTNDVNIVLKNKRNSISPLVASEEKMLRDLGFELRNLTRDEKKRLGQEGIKVISIFRGSLIEETNMEPGFVITIINDKTVDDLSDLLKQLNRSSGKIVLEGFYENYKGDYYYTFDR
ncbi:MAG: Do family serine endopeptidase [Bacteroidota bacterium]